MCPSPATGRASVAPMMFSMFALWIIVFIGIFWRKRWVTPLVLVTLAWTLVLLTMHMTDPIPLNF